MNKINRRTTINKSLEQAHVLVQLNRKIKQMRNRRGIKLFRRNIQTNNGREFAQSRRRYWL
jgi:hypothetical protein